MESILLKSSSSADLELIQILAKKLGITMVATQHILPIFIGI